MKASISAALCLCLLASGCASITGSEMQSVIVSTRTKAGVAVENADCRLQSPKGYWRVSTPSSVMVARSSDDIDVACSKEGESTGLARLISRINGGMVGNIVFGGGIGAIIDHSKGTGYSYPTNVTVTMGETVVIDKANDGKVEETK